MKMMDYLGFTPDVIEKFTDYCEKAMKDAGFTDEEIDNIMKEPVYDRMHEIISHGYGIELPKDMLPADVILNEIGSYAAAALQERFPEEEIAYLIDARSDNTLVINDVEYKPDKCDNIMSLFNGFYPDKNDNLMDMRREKAAQLAEYLDIDPDEIELPDYDEPYGEYKTPEGTFTVMTENETEQAFKDDVNNFIDEYGIGGFMEGFQAEIKRDCIDKGELRSIVEETTQFQVDDMSATDVIEEAKSFHLFDGVQAATIAECKENGNDARLEEIANEVRDELVTVITDAIINGYKGDVCKWITDNFGEESLDRILKENPQMLDRDKIVDRCQEADGYGHSLAHWNGETIETADFYAFKQDGSDQRSDKFIAEYLCVDKDEVARLNNLKSQSAVDRD